MPLYPASPTITIPTESSTTGTELTNSLSATASVLAASNTNRKGLTIFNSLSQTLYVDVSNAVATNNYMVSIPAGAFYELPTNKIYTGAFYGILASGTGSVEVREFS